MNDETHEREADLVKPDSDKCLVGSAWTMPFVCVVVVASPAANAYKSLTQIGEFPA
jgi:hypothetical protein